MIVLTLGNPGDQLLVGSMNVLLQVTFVTAVILLLAVFVRRNPAIRYGLLCTALALVLLSPAITFFMQSSGKSLLTVSMLEENATSITGSTLKRPVAETQSPPSFSQPLSLGEFAGEQNTSGTEVDLQNPTEPNSVNGELRAGSPPEFDRAQQESADISRITQPKTNWIGTTLRVAMPGLLFVWLSGSVILLFRLVIGWCRLASILRSAKPNTNTALAESFEQAGRTFPLHPLPELVLSLHLSGPISAGLLRPRVVFPEQAVVQIDPQQLREIFVHEIAHSARRDQVILLIQNLMSALFWLHPLVKVLNRRLAQAREEVCDNYVLATTDATSYSHTLLTLARLIQTERLLPGAIGLFTSRWKLEHRVAGLLDEKRSRLTRLSKNKFLSLIALTLAMIACIAGGTITLTVAQTKTSSTNDEKPNKQKTAPATQPITIHGTITTHKGKPAAGAQVAVYGSKPGDKVRPKRELLGESVADKAGKAGHYELALPDGISKAYAHAYLFARTEESVIRSRPLDLSDDQITLDLKLPPPLFNQIRFVDPKGRPAADLPAHLMNFTTIPISGQIKPLSDRRNRPWNFQKPATDTRVSYSPRKTNDHGVLKLSIFELRNSVTLKIPGTEKFAPQWIYLNSGMPEERSKHDETYRDIVRNIKPGEDATIVLAPAQIFAGTVLLGDSGKPAAHARIKIWASQQEQLGSMVSIEGKTNEAGQFRLNPRPGVRFSIIAYPPTGTPYQVQELKDLRWSSGAASKNIEIKLDKVVLAQGTVVDARTGKPLQGASVQYYPESANNKNLANNMVTGWQSIQKTDEAGKFKISVLSGPGTLLVHAAERNFILQEAGSKELHSGKPGGTRIYAHAFQKVNPATGKSLEPMKIELQTGTTVSGTLVDEQGKPVKHALVISRLKILPLSPEWRAYSDEANHGKFELHGLRKDEEYPIFFLDPKNRLGAKVMISTRNKSPKIVLKPCGSANARFVDPDGKPIADEMLGSLKLVVTPGQPRYDLQAIRRGETLADEARVANIDRTNYRLMPSNTTNAQGKMAFPALIPGAQYRHTTIVDGRPIITHKFVVQPGAMFDMGDIEVQLKE